MHLRRLAVSGGPNPSGAASTLRLAGSMSRAGSSGPLGPMAGMNEPRIVPGWPGSEIPFGARAEILGHQVRLSPTRNLAATYAEDDLQHALIARLEDMVEEAHAAGTFDPALIEGLTERKLSDGSVWEGTVSTFDDPSR